MKPEPIAGYPLQWPASHPKIPPHLRDRSSFRTTPGRARNGLIAEVRRMGGADLVISTNIPLKKDGTPYAGGYRIDDEAVAVYFNYYGERVVFCCDRWQSMAENMHAIAKTIEAIRGIERWGSGDMLKTAMSGFAQLPPPSSAARRDWWEVLGINPGLATVSARFRELSMKLHPDRPGGSHDKFTELTRARDEALEELGQ
jgi:hypothetical protein